MTTVSIIVPCRDEDMHIDAFLESVLSQRVANPALSLEVVIADGMSEDGTRQRLEAWRRRDSRLVIVDNPARTTSAGLNRAIGQATGEFIVRMDVHTTYAPDYVAHCLAALLETNATCVGGPWCPGGETKLQRAIAHAFSSPIGSGGAASRRMDYTGPVDTVYLGAWRRVDLIRLGGFDESLVRNQDDELCLRIRRSGGTVWQSASICSRYVPRNSLRSLLLQFYQYGYWKVPVIRKHGGPASARHLAPFAFVATLLLLLFLAPWLDWASIVLAIVLVAYASVVLSLTASAPGAASNPFVVALAVSTMHVGYGLGFARGLLDFVVLRRGPAEAMTRPSR